MLDAVIFTNYGQCLGKDMNEIRIDEKYGKLSNLKEVADQGGNSIVYRAQINAMDVVVKVSTRIDGVARTEREFRNLNIVHQIQPMKVPQPICLTTSRDGYVMSLVEGSSPRKIENELAQSMIDFLVGLQNPKFHVVSGSFASDHVVKDIFGIEQLSRRIMEIKPRLEGENKSVLVGLQEYFDKYVEFIEERKVEPKNNLIVSPSDFGIHNMIQGGEQSEVVFIDFEYLGIDRPEKLLVDTLLHPRNMWNLDSRKVFASNFISIFHVDVDYLNLMTKFAKINWNLIHIRRHLERDYYELSNKELDTLFKFKDLGDFAEDMTFEEALELL